MYVHFLLQVASSHPGMGTSSSSVQVKWSVVHVWDWEHHSALMWCCCWWASRRWVLGVEATGHPRRRRRAGACARAVEEHGELGGARWASKERASCGGSRQIAEEDWTWARWGRRCSDLQRSSTGGFDDMPDLWALPERPNELPDDLLSN
jgi:hypothetical protein